jgi:hypothetical protein
MLRSGTQSCFPVAAPQADRLGAARALVRAGRCADAQRVLDAAIARDPQSAGAHYLRGEALFLERRIDAALVAYAEAVQRGIHDDQGLRASAMSGMVPGDFGWMCHMLCGDFEAAWRISDAAVASRPPRRVMLARPRHLRSVWDGTPPAGRRVLVRCHHGLGDTLQFARYLPMLAQFAREVTVVLPASLAPLFQAANPPFAVTVDTGELQIPDGERVEIEITELAYAFRTQSTNIPAAVPYVSVDRARVAAMRRRLREDRRFKIGLVWAAGAWKPERSLPLDQLLSALPRDPQIAVYSLQRGPAADAWNAVAGGHAAIGALASDDAIETAATISALDLVVTVDTMVAHLAGALGAPVWTLLHHAADWRWMLERADSPWYPTMTLFRQSRAGAWDDVMTTIGRALVQRDQARTLVNSRCGSSAASR